MVKQQILRNNITLVTEKISSANTASVGIWFYSGARVEKKGEHGISHFTEHLLFKGTTSKSTHDIAVAFDRIGGMVNAFTERDCICVFFEIPVDKHGMNFYQALQTVCDMCVNCNFPEEEIEKERLVVQSEISASQDDPDDIASENFSKAIFPNQTLSASITGTIKEVDMITREQIIAWYKKYIVSGEMSVFAAGNFDENLLLESLEKLPQHKKRGELHAAEKIQFNSCTKRMKSRLKQSQVFLAFPIEFPLSIKEYQSLAVFDAMAGDTMSSRLFENLREKNGLCYTTFSFFTMYEDFSFWCAYASCEKKNLQKLVQQLENEIVRMTSDDFTDEEFENAKSHIVGNDIMSDSVMSSHMRSLQALYYNDFPLQSREELIKSILEVTKNDIIEITRKLLDMNKKALFIYG